MTPERPAGVNEHDLDDIQPPTVQKYARAVLNG